MILLMRLREPCLRYARFRCRWFRVRIHLVIAKARFALSFRSTLPVDPCLYCCNSFQLAFRWARNTNFKNIVAQKKKCCVPVVWWRSDRKKGERWMPAAVYIWNGKAKGKGCNTDIITLPEPHTNIREGKQGELDTREGGGSRWLLKSFVPLPCVAALLAYIFLGLRIEFTWCCSWGR